MKRDIFEFRSDMTRTDVAWRVLLLVVILGAVLMDLFIWRA
jgi:hypothetical protein